MTYTLHLENIHCKNCANNIKEEMEEVYQIQDTQVDVAQQTVTLETSEIMIDKIITTLEGLGFPIKKSNLES